MFDALEQKEGDIEELALNLRHAFNLPLPDNVEILEASDTEMTEVLEETEVYQSEYETTEAEYIENDDEKSSQAQSELVQEQSLYTEVEESVGYEYEEYIESTASQDQYEPELPAKDEEIDEISKHFM